MACEALKPVTSDDFTFETGIDARPNDSDGSSSDTDDTDDTIVPIDNTAPRANAGEDKLGLNVDQSVLLDASGSSDLDGDPLQYQWSLLQSPAGSTATVINATAITAQIYLDRPGDYRFELTVSDGYVEDSDHLLLQVDEENQAPLADAGFDQQLTLGAVVQLSGAGSYDPDGDQLTYTWRFLTRPAGSVATLAGSAVQPAVSPRFTADKVGVFSIELVVDDGEASSDPAVVSVTVQDSGGGSTGGGSSSSDCLSCAAEAEDQLAMAMTAGDAASGFGLLGLPFLVLLHLRRRED